VDILSSRRLDRLHSERAHLYYGSGQKVTHVVLLIFRLLLLNLITVPSNLYFRSPPSNNFAKFGLQIKSYLPIFSWTWQPIPSTTSTCPPLHLLHGPLQLPFRPNLIKWMTPPRLLTFHAWLEPFHTHRLSTPFSSRRLPTPWRQDLMNSGSQNEQQMEWKLGARSRPSWRTLNLHRILEQFELQQINGACTTTFPRFPLLPLPLHHFQFYHILNIPTYTLNNRCPQCQTILIYYNPVGDAPHNIILKVLLYRFIGHHGARLTFFTSRNNSWSYDTTSDVGTHGLHTWTYTTWTEWCDRCVRFKCLNTFGRFWSEKMLLLLAISHLVPSNIEISAFSFACSIFFDRSLGFISWTSTPWHQKLNDGIHNLPFFRASSKHVAGSISSGVCFDSHLGLFQRYHI
jgi:hypothetical protein